MVYNRLMSRRARGRQMKTSPELQKAVAEYRKGSIEAFNAIYEQSYKYLHTCVIHVVKNEDMAMDMLQETYLEISKSISQLKNMEDFLSWAAMIANRKCFANLKKQKDILLDGSSLGDSDSDSTDGVTDYFENIADNEEFIPETVLQDREKQRLMKEIIDSLNDMQRLCVIGFYYNEQKQEEIAEELGIPVNTVKSHLNRAKAKIKEAVVELDVKKGTRLYSFAPFMLLFYAEEAKACPLTPMSQELKNSLGLSANAQMSLHASNVAKKTLLSTTKGKILLTVSMVAVGTVAIIGAKTIVDNRNDVTQEATSFVEETIPETVFPEEQTIEAEKGTVENITKENIEEENNVSPEEQEGVVSDAILSDLIAISGEYDSYGVGNAGLIPVGKKGKFGLVTYDNQIVVPLEYKRACKMVDSQGNSFFGDGEQYYVYDKNGNLMFTTTKTVHSISDGIVLAKDGGKYDTSFIYYNVDGTVLYEGIEERDVEKDATSFGEGYAYFGNDYDVLRIDKTGKVESMTEILHEKERREHEKRENPNSGVYVDSIGFSFRMDIPMGAVNQGYYLSRGASNSIDTYGFVYINNIDEEEGYTWDTSSIAAMEGYEDFSYRWELSSFYDEGAFYSNYGTIICPIYGSDRRYYLIDTSKLEYISQDTVHGSMSDEEYMKLSFTPITDEALLAKADYIGMNNEKYWLIENGEEVGYIDHAGNSMGIFEQATEFYDGKAMIMENGRAYLIDENFNRLKDYGEVRGIENKGEVFQFRTKEGNYIVKP